MRSQPLSPEALTLVASLFRALSEPSRLRLVQSLQSGERSVSELVAVSETTQSNVSKHLRVLQDAGLVARRQEGSTAYYRVADPLALELCDLVCVRLADRLTDQAKVLGGSARRRR
jgi:DNA-binding transcriptional ArsR family regulator